MGLFCAAGPSGAAGTSIAETAEQAIGAERANAIGAVAREENKKANRGGRPSSSFGCLPPRYCMRALTPGEATPPPPPLRWASIQLIS